MCGQYKLYSFESQQTKCFQIIIIQSLIKHKRMEFINTTETYPPIIQRISRIIILALWVWFHYRFMANRGNKAIVKANRD